MATYRIDVPASGGTYTAATLSGDCQITNFSTSSNTEFSSMITDWAYDPNDKIRLTANTNSSSSSRDGYMVVNYSIGGNSCSNTIHIVQSGSSTPTASGYYISIHLPVGRTSPRFNFLDNGNNVIGGYSRVSTETSALTTWNTSATITKVSFAENGNNITGATINGYAGVTLLSNGTINTGSTETTLDLTQSFNTSDYNDGNKTISITFT